MSQVSKLNQIIKTVIMDPIMTTFQETLKLKIQTSTDFITLDPHQFSITCKVPNHFLTSPILYATHAQYKNKALTLSHFTNKKDDCEIKGVLEIGTKSTIQWIYQYECMQLKEGLSLKYQTSSILTLCPVLKPKYVKNEKLDEILNGKGRKRGAVSMDQSGRLLLEEEGCEFPILGLWVQTDCIETLHIYTLISEFLHTSYADKILIKSNKQNFIYFVQIVEGQIPECFLVRWQKPPKIKTHQALYTVGEEEIQIVFGTDSLEFTLSAPQKSITNPESSSSKQQIFKSPSKSISNDQFVQQLEKLHLVESPQFSSIKKSVNWEQECNSLRNIVYSQEKQINILKLEINRLKKYLSFTHQSVISPSQKQKAFFHSPLLFVESCSEKKECVKKLSVSDLNISSCKNLWGEMKRKSIVQNEEKEENEFEEEPWDHFELIQDN